MSSRLITNQLMVWISTASVFSVLTSYFHLSFYLQFVFVSFFAKENWRRSCSWNDGVVSMLLENFKALRSIKIHGCLSKHIKTCFVYKKKTNFLEGFILKLLTGILYQVSYIKTYIKHSLFTKKKIFGRKNTRITNRYPKPGFLFFRH